MAYQVLIASSSGHMTSLVYTASLSGWLVVGGASSSGSMLIQSMMFQDSLIPAGSPILAANPVALPASSFPAGALPQGQFSWPPETGIPGIGSDRPT